MLICSYKCKCPINLITNLNLVSKSHSHTPIYTHISSLQIHTYLVYCCEITQNKQHYIYLIRHTFTIHNVLSSTNKTLPFLTVTGLISPLVHIFIPQYNLTAQLLLCVSSLQYSYTQDKHAEANVLSSDTKADTGSKCRLWIESHDINNTAYITTIFYKYGTHIEKHVSIKRGILVIENDWLSVGFGSSEHWPCRMYLLSVNVV
jgi:hypothetical protein